MALRRSRREGLTMIGAGLVALVAFLAAWVFASENKETEKPRSVVLAFLAAFVGSVAVLVAFPDMLGWKFGIPVGLPTTLANLLIAAVGVIIILLAIGKTKLPTLFIALGMLLVVWVLFRLIPTAPEAFADLGPGLAEGFSVLWGAIVEFFKDLVP